MKSFDTIIVGAGIAGLTSAYFLSKASKRVCVIDAGDGIIKSSSSQMAQGGIAGDQDWQSHMQDTLKAGENKNNQEIVELFCKETWAAIEWLKNDIGVKFRDEPTQEGAHSKRRVWTTGDDTGFQIYKQLLEVCKQEKNITWIHKTRVEKIVKQNECFFVVADEQYQAASVILSTGGIGGLFDYSTNPENLKGDGLLLAYECGAELEDLDVIQFHPTGLKSNDRPVFLLTEALRGEGAYLRNEKGKRFMESFDQQELESRKIVVEQMLKQQEVFLDLREKPKDFWQSHFPNICKKLEEEGFDISTDLIPVVPTQHFLCGGVKVDKNSESSVENLFVVGECSSTGLHGNNRLASNSLSEAVVFGKRCAFAIKNRELKIKNHGGQGVDELSTFNFQLSTQEDLQTIRQLVQKYIRPDLKDKVALKAELEKLSDSKKKRVALLLCL